jgi:hypothetical protein
MHCHMQSYIKSLHQVTTSSYYIKPLRQVTTSSHYIKSVTTSTQSLRQVTTSSHSLHQVSHSSSHCIKPLHQVRHYVKSVILQVTTSSQSHQVSHYIKSLHQVSRYIKSLHQLSHYVKSLHQVSHSRHTHAYCALSARQKLSTAGRSLRMSPVRVGGNAAARDSWLKKPTRQFCDEVGGVYFRVVSVRT